MNLFSIITIMDSNVRRRSKMKKDRLVGFFDGVIAIIITVLVLELPKIKGTTLAAVWENRMHYFAYITTLNIKLKETVISLKRHKITTILQISSFVIGLFNPVFMLMIGFISLSIWYIPMPKLKNLKK